MLKWTTVHPRKRKDPICTANIQDGYLSVKVEIYYRTSWFDPRDDDRCYELVIAGRSINKYWSLEDTMELAEERVRMYLRDLKDGLEQKIREHTSVIAKIDAYQKKWEDESHD